jgi:ElaB/YqjD/DUF883 family membrane-anchored ribosome-binding protein
VGEDTRAIEGQIEQTREHMGETVSALAYKADVPGRVKESAADKKDAITGKLAGARHAIAGTGGEAVSSAGDGARRTVGMAQENPLGLAVGAAAIGFVIGSLVPRTRIEEERIGPMAAEAREQVTDLASEALEHGKQVAADTMEAAKETAAQSGEQHAEQLRTSAQESAGDLT